jgi:hypothetical protein
MTKETWTTDKGHKVEVTIPESPPVGLRRVDNRRNYRKLEIDSCANCEYVSFVYEKYVDFVCDKNLWWCPVGEMFICDLHIRRKY